MLIIQNWNFSLHIICNLAPMSNTDVCDNIEEGTYNDLLMSCTLHFNLSSKNKIILIYLAQSKYFNNLSQYLINQSELQSKENKSNRINQSSMCLFNCIISYRIISFHHCKHDHFHYSATEDPCSDYSNPRYLCVI